MNANSKLKTGFLAAVVWMAFLGSSTFAATVTWNGGGDGVSWSDGNNWVGGSVPGKGSDVSIGVVAGNPTIQITGSFQINSLTTGTDLEVAGSISIVNGLTLNAKISVDGSSAIYFSGTQTLGGTGEVNLSSGALFAQGDGTQAGAAVLTIGPDITVRSSTYGTINPGSVWDSVVNKGTLIADAGNLTFDQYSLGGTLSNPGTIEAMNGGGLQLFGKWSNTGTINLTDSGLYLGGNFTLASLGTVINHGSTIAVGGTLDNSGQTTTLSDPWYLYGTIKGGTIKTAGSGSLSVNGGTFDGAELDSDVTVLWGGATVLNGLTLNGKLNIIPIISPSNLVFKGTQILSGTGEVLLGGNDTIGPDGDGTQAGAAVLTIGPNITVHGSGSVQGFNSYDRVINQGTISADNIAYGYYSIISVGNNNTGATITNQGTMQAINGGSLYVTNLVDAKGLSSNTGGYLYLDGTWTNSGTLTADNSTLSLNGTWSNSGTVNATNSAILTLNDAHNNSGTINVTDSTLNLAGTISLGSLGTLVKNNSTTNIMGTLDNTGQTLTVGTASGVTAGAWNLFGGTIKGGTIKTTGSGSLTLQTGTLDGVTLNNDTILSVDGSITVLHGLTLNAKLTIYDNGRSSALFFQRKPKRLEVQAK